MNGMLPLRMQRSGKRSLRFMAGLLVWIFMASGCSFFSPGDGRGDWTLDLCGGYCICRVNSREKVLIYKEDYADSGGKFVLETNYYICAYQMDEPYVFLKGIQTKRWVISDEELKSRDFQYYLVDTDHDEVIGPSSSEEEFAEVCISEGTEMPKEWLNCPK